MAMDQFKSNLFSILFLIVSISIVKVRCKENGWPTSTLGMTQTNWTGTWQGVIEAYPDGQLGHGYNVTYIIGPYPMTDETCVTWGSTFSERGVLKMTKNNRFCRGHGAADLYILDGETGGKAAVQWIHDILVASFKVDGVFTVISMRIRGDTLQEEIIISDDKPGFENVLVSMPTHSIHIVKMKRN